MLVVTYADIGKLHKALTEMDDRALPYAAKNALNTSAFATRRQWESEGRTSMAVRNTWTFRARLPTGVGHAVIKARLRKKIEQMEAVSGNAHPYMAEQERGFMRFAVGRVGVPIPTDLSRIAMAHHRLVRKKYWRTAMKLGPRFDMANPKFRQTGPKSRQQRYIAGSIRAAKARGMKFIYLDLGTKRGIYDVTGKRKMIQVWDMSRKSTRTRANPMLRRTLRTLKPAFLIYHRSALEEQIRFVMRKRGLRP